MEGQAEQPISADERIAGAGAKLRKIREFVEDSCEADGEDLPRYARRIANRITEVIAELDEARGQLQKNEDAG